MNSRTMPMAANCWELGIRTTVISANFKDYSAVYSNTTQVNRPSEIYSVASRDDVAPSACSWRSFWTSSSTVHSPARSVKHHQITTNCGKWLFTRNVRTTKLRPKCCWTLNVYYLRKKYFYYYRSKGLNRKTIKNYVEWLQVWTVVPSNASWKKSPNETFESDIHVQLVQNIPRFSAVIRSK